jgi:hypothetical protein
MEINGVGGFVNIHIYLGNNFPYTIRGEWVEWWD